MFPIYAPPGDPRALAHHRLWATYYYIFSTQAIPANRAGVELLGTGNTPLGIRLTEKDYCLAGIEGTVTVAQTGTGGPVVTTLNYLDASAPQPMCDCRRYADVSAKVGHSRFRQARGPFGDGARNYLLVPYRSIAVDRNTFPLGTVLYVPAADGVSIVLPDNSAAVHDGYFFAADVGGNIKGNHIDIFQGNLRNRPFAPFIRSKSTAEFEAYVVTDPAVIAALRAEHLGQPAPAAPGGPAPPPVAAPSEEVESLVPALTGIEVLRKGSTGVLVRRWQTFLRGQGFDPQGVDGNFGPDTAAATIAFQTRHRLDADGVVGNQTWGKAIMLGLAFIEESRPATDRSGDNWPPRPTRLRQLSHDERVARFGSFTFRHAPEAESYENIEITGRWEDDNIVKITVPQLTGLKGGGTGRVRLHRDLEASFRALWAAWEAAGLLDRLLTWEGMFVPRFKRRTSAADIRAKNPRALSNHSWGTAFDVNYAWNKLGAVPALLGQKGCVRELVALANQHGWYWGGHFSSPRDGMHFEAGMPI